MKAELESSEEGQAQTMIRIIASGVSIANSRDVAEWLHVKPEFIFNFHPKVRPISMEAIIHSFDQPDPNMRLFSITRQLIQDLQRHSKKKPILIFTADKKTARVAAAHLNNYA